MTITRKEALAAFEGGPGPNPYMERVTALQKGQQQAQNDQQLAKLQDYLKEQGATKRLQQAQDVLDQYSGKGKNVGVAVSSEGASLKENEPDPMAKLVGKSASESKSLDQGMRKELNPYIDQMDAARTIHQLMDNPTALNDKNVQAKLARMYEGSGQRLLQSMIQTAGGKPDLVRNGADFVNFLTGTAQTGLSADKQKAIREEAITNGKLAADNFNKSYQQFSELAPVRAPVMQMTNPQGLQSAIQSYGMRGVGLAKELSDREQAYRQQSGARSGLNAPQPVPQAPVSNMDKLRSFFGVKGPGAQPAPQQAPSAGSPQGQTIKQYSPSRNQTRVSQDGGQTWQVLDGKQ